MAPDRNNFQEDCFEAANRFLQTMIVVDDEAEFGDTTNGSAAVAPKTPGRAHAKAASATPDGDGKVQTRPLDAQALIEAAMDRNIICSVLQTKQDKQNADEISKAAQHADIVCLDWEIEGDDGKRAREIIYKILGLDEQQNGRMRLIAIYTAVPDQGGVLGKVVNEMPNELREKSKPVVQANSINGDSGIRIAYFRKDSGGATGTGEPEQIPVAQLPERLIKEFASISPGILSNIALATIASIRRSTHHTVMRYDPKMDGPYLAHRGKVGNFHDSIGYGVDITLEDLQTYIGRDKIEEDFASKEAMNRRLQEKRREVGLNDDDYERVANFISGTGRPPRNNQLRTLTKQTFQLVGVDEADIAETCNRFNYITSVSRHLGNTPSEKPTELRLGTIVLRNDGKFFLCVQPSCDSLRLEGMVSFAFLPLNEMDATDNNAPNYVVRIRDEEGSRRLQISKKAHTEIKSWYFEADGTTKKVLASIDPDTGDRVFDEVRQTEQDATPETDRALYKLTWICELKPSRVVKDVQFHVANKLGRIGIDEFELHRR